MEKTNKHSFTSNKDVNRERGIITTDEATDENNIIV